MNLDALAAEVTREAQVLALFRSGLTRRAICDQLHMGHDKVTSILGELAPQRRKGGFKCESAHYDKRPMIVSKGRQIPPDVIKAALYHGIGVKATAKHLGIPVRQLVAWIKADQAWCESNGLCPRCEQKTECCKGACKLEAIIEDFISDECAMALLGTAVVRAFLDDNAGLAYAEDTRRGALDSAHKASTMYL